MRRDVQRKGLKINKRAQERTPWVEHMLCAWGNLKFPPPPYIS